MIQYIEVGLLILFGFLYVYLFNNLFKLKVTNFKYSTIEGLRGYLAYFVFIHHFTIWYFCLHTDKWVSPESNFFNHLGTTSVSLFFMITGFLFTNMLFDKKPIDWKMFFLHRFYRLVPLYLFSIICLVFIVLYVSHFQLNQPLTEFIEAILYWISFTYIGTPQINQVGYTFMINAGVVWSLAYEWFFYFTIPIIGFLFFRKNVSYFTLIICLVLAYIFIFFGNPIYIFLLYFVGGGIVSYCVRSIAIVIKLKHYFFSIAIIILLSINIYFFHDPAHYVSILLNTLIFLIIASGNSFFGILNLKISMIFGQLSYSIYLMHGFVLFVFNELIINPKWLLSLSINRYYLLGVFYSAAVILVAFTTNKFIEVPFMKLKRK